MLSELPNQNQKTVILLVKSGYSSKTEFSSILQEPCFVTSSRSVITIYCFVENLISAHSQGPKI